MLLEIKIRLAERVLFVPFLANSGWWIKSVLFIIQLAWKLPKPVLKNDPSETRLKKANSHKKQHMIDVGLPLQLVLQVHVKWKHQAYTRTIHA